jgi:ubiquinol-cytochrome c reductase cytochrome b subunit
MNSLIRAGLATYYWLDDRLGVAMMWNAVFGHKVPKSVNWWYVFGSATLFAFTFQIITGIFLAFAYVPSPDHAYQSLQWITNHEFLGNVIRGIHYWGASAMVLLVFIHMTANYLIGSYKFPRELQWLSGAILLMCTILMAFTGQLLRWNQDAYWAVVVGAEQAARTPILGTWVAQLLTAGPVVGGNTLTRFYAIHVFLVPGLMFLLLGMHLYLVIYKGVSEWPVPGEPVDPKTYWPKYQQILHEEGEPFFPKATSMDAFMGFLGGAVVVILAITVGAAHLGHVANPLTPANPRPDWYLIWYFALLALIPPASENYFIILFPLLAFVILLLIPLANKGERHFSRRPWAIAVVIFMASATAILVYVGYQSPWSPKFVGANFDQIPSVPATAYRGLAPQQVKGAKLMHVEGCVACHTVDGVGGQRGPDLTRIADRATEGQLYTRIMNGGGGMPAYGNTMTPQQANQIVSFLLTLGTHNGPPSQGAGATGSPGS